MRITVNSFRRQHDSAMAQAMQIMALAEELDQAASANISRQIGAMLIKLTGDLRVHFAQEDSLLYPHLMDSEDPQVAETARDFFDEMGRLGPAFEQFAAKWTGVGAVEADKAAFQAEASTIFLALSKRIERENDALYPLVR